MLGTMENPALFALAVLTILATPGPTNTLLATSGATVGWRRSLVLMPAEVGGYLIAILTIGMLVGPVLATVPVLATALRVAVGAYLALLAVRLWRRGRAVVISGDRPVTPAQVFVTTLLNPKALVFALGVVPFGAPRVWPYLVGFTVLLAAVATAWIAAGVLLGRVAADRGQEHAVVRVGAFAVGAFALLIVVAPLLR